LFRVLTNCFLNGRVCDHWYVHWAGKSMQRRNNCPSAKTLWAQKQTLTRIPVLWPAGLFSNWFGVCSIKELGHCCAARVHSSFAADAFCCERDRERDIMLCGVQPVLAFQQLRRDASFKTKPAKNNNALVLICCTRTFQITRSYFQSKLLWWLQNSVCLCAQNLKHCALASVVRIFSSVTLKATELHVIILLFRLQSRAAYMLIGCRGFCCQNSKLRAARVHCQAKQLLIDGWCWNSSGEIKRF